MPVKPPGDFSNIDKLIDTIASDKASPNPGIDRASLLAELAVVKMIVAKSRFPDIKARIPDRIRPSITGPEVRVPRYTGPEIDIPDTLDARITGSQIRLPGGGDAGITGPEVDTKRCPLCKRPY